MPSIWLHTITAADMQPGTVLGNACGRALRNKAHGSITPSITIASQLLQQHCCVAPAQHPSKASTITGLHCSNEHSQRRCALQLFA